MIEIIPLWLVNTLSFITVFSVMTAIGTTVDARACLALLRAPGLLIRGLVSVLVVVPMVGIAAGFALGLSLPERVGIALMAIAPGAPLALRRALGSGGHAGFAPTLQIAVALLAVPAMPVWVFLGNWLFGTHGFVDVAAVARQICLAQLLPLILGAAASHLAPATGALIGTILARAGAVLLIVAIAAQIVDLHYVILSARFWPILAAVITTLAALAAGHLLGGRAPDVRHAVAIAGALRNIGLALLVADSNHVLPDVIVVIVSYALTAIVVVSLYILLWRPGRGRGLTPVPTPP